MMDAYDDGEGVGDDGYEEADADTLGWMIYADGADDDGHGLWM